MKRSFKKGCGLLNRAINSLPFELHIPGYQFCGPGSKLEERLARKEEGINLLDQACRQHDIAYSQSKDLETRHKADRVLANKAWARYNTKGVPTGEKVASWLVASAMNAKTKLGAGYSHHKASGGRIRRRKRTTGKGRKKSWGNVGRGPKGGAGKKKRVKRRNNHRHKQFTFSDILRQAKAAIRGSGIVGAGSVGGGSRKLITKAASSALHAIRRLRKGRKGAFNHMRRKERTLPLPKSGGVLPLLPIFAGLSALGSLAGGAAGVAKAITETKDARKRLGEMQRHNETMEAIALRQGRGLYIRPYKKGLGLYMAPYQKPTKNL